MISPRFTLVILICVYLTDLRFQRPIYTVKALPIF